MSEQARLFRPTPSDKPVLHLRSWAWVNARRRDGLLLSSPAYTIMAHPRAQYGEIGEGRVPALTPQGAEVEMLQQLVRSRRSGTGLGWDGDLLARYRASMEARWASLDLSPAGLLVHHAVGLGRVQPGSVLCCACSTANALRGECHRAWAAPVLARSGWSVWLDGAEVASGG